MSSELSHVLLVLGAPNETSSGEVIGVPFTFDRPKVVSLLQTSAADVGRSFTRFEPSVIAGHSLYDNYYKEYSDGFLAELNRSCTGGIVVGYPNEYGGFGLLEVGHVLHAVVVGCTALNDRIITEWGNQTLRCGSTGDGICTGKEYIREWVGKHFDEHGPIVWTIPQNTPEDIALATRPLAAELRDAVKEVKKERDARKERARLERERREQADEVE